MMNRKIQQSITNQEEARQLCNRKKFNNVRIAFLAENKTADIPALTIKSRGARGLGGAKMHLQLDEQSYDIYFEDTIIDKETGNR